MHRGFTIADVLVRWIVLSLVAAPLVPAQLHSLDVSQYLHSSWTAQEGYFRGIGISNHAVAQTGDGYIWILSPSGLYRFDGVRFVEWQPPAGESFPGNPPSQLLASREGSLWIGGQGVAQIRADGTWHKYHELDKLRRVRLAEDNDGVIWAGAETPGSLSLFRIDRGKASAYKLPEFAGLGFTPLLVDRAGRLWADTERGIWRILPGPPKLIQEKTLRSSAFGEDSAGALLYAQEGRIRRLSAEGASEDYLGKIEGSPINTMLRDKEGGLWIGTTGQGIVHLHEGRLDRFTSLDGLSSDIVESIFQDREGNIWVTSPDSLDRFTRPAVPKLTRKQGLSGDSVNSVLTDRQGITWIGTSNGFDELVADHMTRPGGQFPDDIGRALVETHEGRILMTTSRRDQAVTPNHARLIPAMSAGAWLQGYKNVFSIAEDNEGTLWAVSQESGLLHLRENGELIEALNDPKWGDYAYSVVFDEKREGIWFTTHNGKVFFLKDGKIAERYGPTDGLPHAPVRVLHVDDDGGVWLAETAGLAHLMNHKVSVLGRKNGLPCDRVHWMRSDEDHQVWLYTECGLVSFSEHDLSLWVAQPSRSVAVTHYLDNTEGVENIAVGGWYTPQTAVTKDGRILFAMRSGLGILDPHNLNKNPLPPPVRIEGITADGREMGSTGQPSLPARTGVVHIVYTALSFAAPRKVRFRYKLEGNDKEWSPPVSLREVTYTNLPPRKYSFKVVACNNSGVWNQQGATIEFVVLPAWYQTLWFKLMALSSGMGLLVALYFIRVGRIERELTLRFDERMTERMRIAREIHDTLLQSLQGLVLSFSNFASEVDATARVHEEMETALDRADRLIISGRDRIRDLRGESDETTDLTVGIRSVVDDARSVSGPKISVSSAGPLQQLNAIVQEEVLRIVKEALSNACRHSGASEICIDTLYDRHELRVSIRDNGRGMDLSAVAAAQDRHFGLRGMRERALAIGGWFSVQSARDQGTVIRLSVPARIAYRGEGGWLRRRFFRRNNADI